MTGFPPLFSDAALSYGGALFGLAAISSLGLAILFDLWFSSRHDGSRCVGVTCFIPMHPRAPLSAYRFQLASAALMMVLGTTPDVLEKLAWGEVALETMVQLNALDRACDFLAAVPGCFFVISYFSNKQVVEHRLEFGGGVPNDPPAADYARPFDRRSVKRYARVLLWALVISAGVTAGKAGL